jgi:fructokinase
MTGRLKIICFGELLWDILPDEQLLGGAPLNVALRLHNLGSPARMISAVGNDKLGKAAIEGLKRKGFPTAGIARLEASKTGTVQVHLHKGSASYTITEDVAWDRIPVDQQLLNELRPWDALVFGSLALRGSYNQKAIMHLLKESPYVVFDLNLRPPHFSLVEIDQWMCKSDLIKMNEEELAVMAAHYQLANKGLKQNIAAIHELTGAHVTCVTLGEKGAILYLESTFYRHPGFQTEVVDTIGAGDSFLATLLRELLRNTDPLTALGRACAMGALVAGKKGANCSVSNEEISRIVGA